MHDAVRTELQLAHAAKERFVAGDKAAFTELMERAERAFLAVDLPRRTPGVPFPLASAFNDAQRDALTLAARLHLSAPRFACPPMPETLRRWLGVDPPGVLESHLVEGEPLWRALQGSPNPSALLDTLPRDVALQALGEIFDVGFGYGLSVPIDLALLRELGPDAREWAIARADAFPTDAHFAGATLKAYIFTALARAGVAIERRWEHLYPNVIGVPREVLVECARALSDDRRASVLARHFSTWHFTPEIVAAFPTADMVEAALHAEEPHSRRWTMLVAELRQNRALVDMVDTIIARTPPPIELFVTRRLKPKSASDLTDIEREQLRVAGRGWDQRDLDADARLGAAPPTSEGSFRGFFEIRNLCGVDGEPLYDALLYMSDAGSIYRAGTTTAIGAVSQGGVRLEAPNPVLRAALQVAIGPAANKRPSAKKKGSRKKP